MGAANLWNANSFGHRGDSLAELAPLGRARPPRMSYGRGVSDLRPGWIARVALAFGCFFRTLFDAEFAARVFRARLPAETPPPSARALPVVTDASPGLVVLGLFQREGRLVDFLEQDITAFPDAEVGAAARLVHEGCRKALRGHATVSPVRSEPEDSVVTIEEGYDPNTLKLTGNVGSKPPYRGTLRHAGWRVSNFRLPVALAGHDATILAPAEVEL